MCAPTPAGANSCWGKQWATNPTHMSAPCPHHHFIEGRDFVNQNESKLWFYHFTECHVVRNVADELVPYRMATFRYLNIHAHNNKNDYRMAFASSEIACTPT